MSITKGQNVTIKSGKYAGFIGVVSELGEGGSSVKVKISGVFNDIAVEAEPWLKLTQVEVI